MGARTEEANSINSAPMAVRLATEGAQWFRRALINNWNAERMMEEIRLAAGRRAQASRARYGAEFDDEINDVAESQEIFLSGFAVSWFVAGLPRVTLPAKLAASFACTSIPAECAPHAPFPWPAFMIDVPDGLFDHEGSSLPKHLCVRISREEAEGTYYTVFAASDLMVTHLFPEVRTIEKLIQILGRDSLRRGDLVLGRVLSCVIFELNLHRPTKARGVGSLLVRAERRGPPACTMVHLTRDVKVDCRQAVRDYIRGASDRKLSVQTLVRGHWKMQPHGAGSSERKFIHVEPYWRGPEDAPIALKNHVLEGAK